ncbi:hypothetical protein WJX77_003012 [Trebouxia sp. C0004]
MPSSFLTSRYCWGVPFSYATGAYNQGDNAFIIYNYNNWEIDIMEDQGSHGDRNAGFGSTDGQWHHIAVTWESSTGIATLYLDGRKAWSTVRAQGMRIPSGGTLVVGREQDCMGGCFDSARGAAGDVQQRYQLEYGAQDFTGVVDELRIWKTVRSREQIQQVLTVKVAPVAALHKHKLSEPLSGPERERALPTSGETNSWSRHIPVVCRDQLLVSPEVMAGDLKPAEPSTEASVRVSPTDPDLVAYWTFEEGSGYLVKDVTANKHDLHIQQPPHWRVVGPQQVCGNGIVEGLEQCDDGDIVAGDGCSATCQVEERYECSGLQPSTCWPANTHPNTAATEAADRRSGGKNSHKLLFLIAAFVTEGIISSAALMYAHCQSVGHNQPQPSQFWANFWEPGWPSLALVGDAPATPYQRPESTPLLQDPQSFPAGP